MQFLDDCHSKKHLSINGKRALFRNMLGLYSYGSGVPRAIRPASCLCISLAADLQEEQRR
jgi:hypothetical protein